VSFRHALRAARLANEDALVSECLRDPMKIRRLADALRNMTANFRSSLLLVSDHETRRLGLELVRDTEALLHLTSTRSPDGDKE
jgi:hypothetical protein